MHTTIFFLFFVSSPTFAYHYSRLSFYIAFTPPFPFILSFIRNFCRYIFSRFVHVQVSLNIRMLYGKNLTYEYFLSN